MTSSSLWYRAAAFLVAAIAVAILDAGQVSSFTVSDDDGPTRVLGVLLFMVAGALHARGDAGLMFGSLPSAGAIGRAIGETLVRAGVPLLVVIAVIPQLLSVDIAASVTGVPVVGVVLSGVPALVLAGIMAWVVGTTFFHALQFQDPAPLFAAGEDDGDALGHHDFLDTDD